MLRHPLVEKMFREIRTEVPSKRAQDLWARAAVIRVSSKKDRGAAMRLGDRHFRAGLRLAGNTDWGKLLKKALKGLFLRAFWCIMRMLPREREIRMAIVEGELT